MEICKLAKTEEVSFCVDMYLKLNDESFIPTDRETSIASLYKLSRCGRFVRTLKKDGVIIAWIYADRTSVQHSNLNFFQQMYYACSESGFLAYKCLIALHSAMYEYARTQDVHYCISSSSHFDTAMVLSRALEKNGWMRRGFLASKRVVPVLTRTAPTGTQVVAT